MASFGKADGMFPHSFGFLVRIAVLKLSKCFWKMEVVIGSVPTRFVSRSSTKFEALQLESQHLLQHTALVANLLTIWWCCYFIGKTACSLAGLMVTLQSIMCGSFYSWLAWATSTFFINTERPNCPLDVAKADRSDCWNLYVHPPALFCLCTRKMCLSAFYFLFCITQ